MSKLQPNCCLKVDFQNVGKHTGGKWLNHDTKRHKGKSIPEIKTWNSPAEYPSCVARCYIKGPDGTMLNPIFWVKVQGQKHPERWEIEHPLGDWIRDEGPNQIVWKSNTRISRTKYSFWAASDTTHERSVATCKQMHFHYKDKPYYDRLIIVMGIVVFGETLYKRVLSSAAITICTP